MHILNHGRYLLTLVIISCVLTLVPTTKAYAAGRVFCATQCAAFQCKGDIKRSQKCATCPEANSECVRLATLASSETSGTTAFPKFISNIHNLFFEALREENKKAKISPQAPQGSSGQLVIPPNSDATQISEAIRQEINRIATAWDSQYVGTFKNTPTHIKALKKMCEKTDMNEVNGVNCGIDRNVGMARLLYCPPSTVKDCKKAFDKSQFIGEMPITFDQTATNYIKGPYQGGTGTYGQPGYVNPSGAYPQQSGMSNYGNGQPGYVNPSGTYPQQGSVGQFGGGLGPQGTLGPPPPYSAY